MLRGEKGKDDNMIFDKEITIPVQDKKSIENLRAGNKILVSGKIYAARDSTLSEISDLVEKGNILPFKNSAVFLSSVSTIDQIQGKYAVGPTSSYRMEAHILKLIHSGLSLLIGKGTISENLLSEMRNKSCVYLGFPGGLSALLSKTVKEVKVLSHEHLANEALFELTVCEMPLIVFSDLLGGYIYRH
ncbi:fumarate hydratase C-terminal domain-containing protein [candidate division WOR-3 bacterium]|nr:fumarate hydratase C-terminal domain-containing protein [candidate division WOR-3 bacterium]